MEESVTLRKSLGLEDNFHGKLLKYCILLYVVLNLNRFCEHPISPTMVISFAIVAVTVPLGCLLVMLENNPLMLLIISSVIRIFPLQID